MEKAVRSLLVYYEKAYLNTDTRFSILIVFISTGFKTLVVEVGRKNKYLRSTPDENFLNNCAKRAFFGTETSCERKKSIFFRQMGFLLFPVGEKWSSSLMRIPSGIFGLVKVTKFQQYLCPFAYFKTFTFLNLERAPTRAVPGWLLLV